MKGKNEVTHKINLQDVDKIKKLTMRKKELEQKNKLETKKEYQEVLKEIIQLEKKMEVPFKQKSFDRILDKKVIPFSPGQLTLLQINKLKSNSQLDGEYYQKLEKIEKIYNERKSITEFENAANEYIKIWMQIK